MSVSGSCHRMMGHSEWSVPVSVTSDDVGQVKYETEISEINFSQKIPPSLSSLKAQQTKHLPDRR